MLVILPFFVMVLPGAAQYLEQPFKILSFNQNYNPLPHNLVSEKIDA
jgi:hypothetical protein